MFIAAAGTRSLMGYRDYHGVTSFRLFPRIEKEGCFLLSVSRTSCRDHWTGLEDMDDTARGGFSRFDNGDHEFGISFVSLESRSVGRWRCKVETIVRNLGSSSKTSKDRDYLSVSRGVVSPL